MKKVFIINLMLIFILIFCLHLSAAEVKKIYSNPIIIKNSWTEYGEGDPYVLRYNGKYYLYVSTKDGEIGIKSWVSKDLINWQYQGLVSNDPLTRSAYAPEVIYWNGMFYMYTSPAGHGHYVLSSKSPAGPFKKASDNLGLSIDGSVFIDDDNSWYFYHAGSQGIVVNQMETPYSIKKEGKILAAYMGGWTEGPMVIKRNDLYYLTYTGNHVLSKGYRINYAVSAESPLGKFNVAKNNPLVISTEQSFNGLGHSSTVMGPNLDSYFIVYHNLKGRAEAGWPIREMNLDRLVFNGNKMMKNVKFKFLPDKSYHFKVSINVNEIYVYINGKLVLDFTDKTPFLSGKTGFISRYSEVFYKNIIINSLKNNWRNK